MSKNLEMEHIAIAIVITALLGLIYTSYLKPVYGNSTSEQIPFLKVLKLVTPFGICLGLAGLGFRGLSNFITLYYDYFNWNNAALCLSVFSSLFILGRMLFSNQINAKGGLNVALICLITEAIGLFLLFLAPNESLALIGAAIAGLGFSLVFPALGVEAVKLAPASNAGAALACYGLFIDLSLGATGPLEGTVINVFGMKYLFLFCAIMVVVGLLIIVIRLMNKKQTAI